MKLSFAWVTDPHFDHLSGSAFGRFLRSLRDRPEDSILITGDITTGQRLTSDLGVLGDTLAERNKLVYFVLGNHDLWNETIEGARRIARQTADLHKNLVYLPAAGVIPLKEDSAFLIGVNGYADARAGDFLRSTVHLVDYSLCHSLRGLKKERLQRVLQDLGEESALEFGDLLAKVPANAQRVYVATHVPPFEQAHWYKDKPGSADFTPHFVNVALGQEILHAAKLRPELDVVVLSGHTHWGTKVRMTPNVTCFVGWAEYGNPIVQDPENIPDRTLRI